MVKSLPANGGDVRDTSLIPGSGRSPGGGHGNPLQYSCQENLLDREDWWPMIHRVTKSRTQLKWLSSHTHACMSSATGPWLTKMVHRSLITKLLLESEAFWFPGLQSDVLFLFFSSTERKHHISSLCLNPRSTQGHISMVPSNWFTRSDKYLGVGSEREGTSFRLQGYWNISTNEAAFMIGLISLYCNVLFHEHLPY